MTSATDTTNGAKVLIGWLLTLVLFAAITRTRWGYSIVYYALWLAVIIVLLGSADRLTGFLSLVRAPGPIGPNETSGAPRG